MIYTQCVAVQNVTAVLRRVTIAIAPTAGVVVPPETVVVDRTKPRLPSTLNVN